ncbi:hypothetical protein Q5P01_004425 [Channa striata]|uniref:Uncharacterized protein n=1 Tax=Channa striata TaxID=64152 RepID=A0AA88NUP5_CHASR|nr:hypothetical protein Q5P01_004425 [Channa striata]
MISKRWMDGRKDRPMVGNLISKTNRTSAAHNGTVRQPRSVGHGVCQNNRNQADWVPLGTGTNNFHNYYFYYSYCYSGILRNNQDRKRARVSYMIGGRPADPPPLRYDCLKSVS